MPLRTKVFTSLYDAVSRRTAVADLTATQRERARTVALPVLPPVTWVTSAIPKGVTVWDSRFTARDGATVPLRLYRPAADGAGRAGGTAGPLPVVVYLHGGGWVLGSTRGYDALCGFVADAVGAVVVSVDYRLAPEHPAPQGVHDCVDAVRWVGEHAAEVGGDSARIAVGGDSAGGNLAAVVCLVARDEGGPVIAHQALLYPGLDATLSYPSIA